MIQKVDIELDPKDSTEDKQMRRISGLSDIQRGNLCSAYDQEIVLKEFDQHVALFVASPTWSARMTPAQAEFLGRLLIEAADRVRKTMEPAKPANEEPPPSALRAVTKGGYDV